MTPQSRVIDDMTDGTRCHVQ